mmetsp:Transcript_32334/g.50037  ORF Transcript_32334/g.50037 Transcript_32334/m.50037 type:complete len:217 (+) Transcript_32334:560-1210(+)
MFCGGYDGTCRCRRLRPVALTPLTLRGRKRPILIHAAPPVGVVGPDTATTHFRGIFGRYLNRLPPSLHLPLHFFSILPLGHPLLPLEVVPDLPFGLLRDFSGCSSRKRRHRSEGTLVDSPHARRQEKNSLRRRRRGCALLHPCMIMFLEPSEEVALFFRWNISIGRRPKFERHIGQENEGSSHSERLLQRTESDDIAQIWRGGGGDPMDDGYCFVF